MTGTEILVTVNCSVNVIIHACFQMADQLFFVMGYCAGGNSFSGFQQ